MKRLSMFGLGVGLLLASASVGFAGSSTGGARFQHPSRELATARSDDRRANPKPYALTGSVRALSWQKQVGPNPSGRPRTLSFKRSATES